MFFSSKIIRMKEFERARRLNLREYNKKVKEEKQAKKAALEQMEEDWILSSPAPEEEEETRK